TQAAAVHIRSRSATQCPDRNAPPPGVGISIIIRGIWRLITTTSLEVCRRFDGEIITAKQAPSSHCKKILVPRLCLGRHCPEGSACRTNHELRLAECFWLPVARYGLPEPLAPRTTPHALRAYGT